METTNEKAIKTIIDNWATAVRAKDIEGILADHSPDVLLYDVPEPFQSKGIDAYRSSWVDNFFPWNGENGNFEVIDLEITAGTDVAYCHGVISCSGIENGEQISLKVRLTVGLVKTGGRWVVAHEHHSLPAI